VGGCLTVKLKQTVDLGWVLRQQDGSSLSCTIYGVAVYIIRYFSNSRVIGHGHQNSCILAWRGCIGPAHVFQFLFDAVRAFMGQHIPKSVSEFRRLKLGTFGPFVTSDRCFFSMQIQGHLPSAFAMDAKCLSLADSTSLWSSVELPKHSLAGLKMHK